MTDEGQHGEPMDAVEMAHAMTGLASGARAFYLALREEGFSGSDAIRLTASWISGLAAGQTK